MTLSKFIWKNDLNLLINKVYIQIKNILKLSFKIKIKKAISKTNNKIYFDMTYFSYVFCIFKNLSQTITKFPI